VDCLDECVPRPDAFFTGILFAACFLCHSHSTALFSYFVSFSYRFLLRFWYSLHISSHSKVFCVFLYSFKFLWFLEYWNIFLRYCTWKFLGSLKPRMDWIVSTNKINAEPEILFCLCVGWILIYLCYLDYYISFCNSCASKLQAVIIPHYFWN
jgi:hypothetical protein